MSTIELIKGDCRDFDPELAHRFQFLCSDLPYSEHVHANITSAGTMGEGSRGYHKQELAFGSLTPELLAHVAKFSARVQGWVVLYSDIESAHIIRGACESALSEYIRSELVFYDPEDEGGPAVARGGYDGVFPWERWSQPQKTGDRPTQGCELITLCWGRAHSRKAWNGPGNLTALHHKSLRGEDKHRTEKPLDQLLDLVCWFSNGPGLPWAEHPRITDHDSNALETVPASVVAGRTITSKPAQNALDPVLDLTMGAGTCAVACELLDRDFLGFELDPKNEGWVDKAEARVEAARTGKLSKRDRERVERWVTATIAEAESVPFPKAEDGSDVKTWERAQRRLFDAYRVGDKL